MLNVGGTYIINGHSPGMVAEAGGRFVCVPEQKVKELYPIMSLKPRVITAESLETDFF